MENNKTFICNSCKLEWNTEFLNQKQGKDYCFDCGEKENNSSEENEVKFTEKQHSHSNTFTCEFCAKNHEGQPIYAHVKNMPDKRNSKEISQICSYCSYARAKKENFYCPRFSSGRDSWDTNLPEFDCFCEQKKY